MPPSLSHTLLLRWLRLALAGALAVVSAQGAASDNLWERLARFDFNGVAEELAHERQLADREKQLVLGVALLNRQPRTPATVAEAARQFEALVDTNATDDVGRWARYLLARIVQLHRTPASTVEAARQYRELMADGGAHPAAQRALLKLAVLLVYDPEVEPDRAQGFREAEALASRVQDAAAMAELRLMLGRAAVFFRLPPEVCLAHLRAALDAGIATPFLRSATLFAVGEFARESGDRELALSSYRTFLVENPRDQRVKLVREHILLLERTTAAR